MKNKLTHIDQQGSARMVDVGQKDGTRRVARAEAVVRVTRQMLDVIREGNLPKGDILAVSRIAGIQAAKRTAELIPLCHPIPLTHVDVNITFDDDLPAVIITTEASATWKTGVEMEALTAAAIAALTIYDMGKSVDRSIYIERIRLLYKSGGKSGEWVSST